MRDGWWRSYSVVVVPILGVLLAASVAVAWRKAKHVTHNSERAGHGPTASTSYVAPEPEITRPSRPTANDIVAMLAPSFDDPRRLEASEEDLGSPDHDVIVWRLRYDGIELENDVRSNDFHHPDWITRWSPIRRSPPRWRPDDALSDESARAHAHLDSYARVRRVYHPKYVQEWKGPAHTAENEVLAVGSFAPAIEVMGRDDYGVLIDAYSGAVLEKRTNWVQ